MALINCPECNNPVSDSAEKCPLCGFNLLDFRANRHIPKTSILSKKKKKGVASGVFTLIGSCILIAAGIPLIALGVGVIMIILGVVSFFIALSAVKKYQYGDCPYCGVELRVVTGNTSFKCPICNNIGIQTETSLETTHEYTPSEKT